MMQDQHKNTLSNFYRNSIIEALDYLGTRYSLRDYDIKSDDIPEDIIKDERYHKFYEVSINCISKTRTLILAFPKSFPDTFPKIYLSKKDYNEIYPIPHMLGKI